MFHGDINDPEKKKFCSKIISNCPLGNHITDSTILTCNECNDGYYLNDFKTICYLAENKIEGCVKYESAFLCKECL